MAVKPIPEGYHTLTPYIMVDDAEKFIEFLTKAFGAEELFRMSGEKGEIAHAEIKIGDSQIMLSESTETHKPSPGIYYLYVADVDAVYKKALAAGGVSISEPKDQLYGDRHAAVKDDSGNQWWIATHIEDVSPEEATRREEEYKKSIKN